MSEQAKNDKSLTEEVEQVQEIQISETIKNGGTNLQDLLKYLSEMPGDLELVSDDDYTELCKRYAGANNNALCPCGSLSGKPYKDCCKLSWQIVQRAWKNKGKEEKAVRKEEHKREKELENVQDLFTVGQSKNGALVFKPHVKMADQQLLAILQQAQNNVLYAMIQGIASKVASDTVMKSFGGPMPSMNKIY